MKVDTSRAVCITQRSAVERTQYRLFRAPVLGSCAAWPKEALHFCGRRERNKQQWVGTYIMGSVLFAAGGLNYVVFVVMYGSTLRGRP